MEYAYLGLFSRVFEWVLKNIFDPVFSFVSNLLTTVLTWVFQKVLAPILVPILQQALEFFIDLWKELYSTQLYMLFSGVLKLIDYLEKAFDVFIGLDEVTYNRTSGTLVEVLMQQKTISTVFWAITLGALGLSLILTIYGTAKSAFDLDFENKRPVSKVMTAMMKTFIQFFTVPFFVYFFLQLSSVILKGVTSIFSLGEQTTLGRTIFVIASLNAAKDQSYNLNHAGGDIKLGISSSDPIRYPFYSLSGDTAVKDYGNLTEVSKVFNLASFDYIIGFIAAVFLLFTIGVCLIIFIQRIFELVLLYIVSPYFVCMMPLDDGEKFSRWREMFIAKCFTGFGSAVGMRLFLMICPLIMGNDIKFGTATSPEMDYMMKLFFLAGGAWAVYKSGPMITSLLSSQAGSAEANTAAMAGGMIYGYTAGALISKGQQALGSALRSPGGKGGRDSAEQEGNTNVKFNGQKGGINSPVMRSSQLGGGRMSGSRLGSSGGIAGSGGAVSASRGVGAGGTAGAGRSVGFGGSASASRGVGAGRSAGVNRSAGFSGSASASRGVGTGRSVGANRVSGINGAAGASRGVSVGRNAESPNRGIGTAANVSQNPAQNKHPEYTGEKRSGLDGSGISVNAGSRGGIRENIGKPANIQKREDKKSPGVTVNPNHRISGGINQTEPIQQRTASPNDEAAKFGSSPERRHTISQGTGQEVQGMSQGSSRRTRANSDGSYQGRRQNEHYRLNIGGSRYTISSGGKVISRRFPGSALSSDKISLTRAGSLGDSLSHSEHDTDGRYRGSSSAGTESSYSSSYESSSAGSESSYSSSYSAGSESSVSSYSEYSDSSSTSSYSASAGSEGSSADSVRYSDSSSSRPQYTSHLHTSQMSSTASVGGVRGMSRGSGVSINYQVSSAPIPAVRRINVSSSNIKVKYSDISIRGLSHSGQQNGRPFTRRSGQ